MIWIDSIPAFDAMIDRLAAQSIIAVDTEADSLHSYFDKVCLIQISGDGEDHVVDPLTKIDLKRFGEVLASPSVTKVLHGGDYDLRILNRDFGFTVANLIDTMICAQLLGYEAFGLAALLDRHFGLKLNKSHQRADWSMRPLPPDMLDYAATDTHHLIALAEILREQLEALGRWPWAMEEFSRLECVRFREADEEVEAFRRLKGLGSLDRRSLAIVKELHGWRDGLARAADRPPFKIIGNDAILEIARERPESRDDLAKIKAVSRYHFARYGSEIMTLVQRALALPEDALPEKSDARPWMRDKVLEARIEKLKKVRDRIAGELKIDGSLVAPRHVLTAIATIEPAEVAQLDQIPAMREWQKRVAGEPLVAALRKQQQPVNRKLF
ncbi:MAG TPA: ribonuclease D [Thermoanaerobaculia bacterium]|nr:ribonuclease D [Thermoanaerobaculia bacterium]